jgi:hypothetical protein
MKAPVILRHEFVEFIPEVLEVGIIYVSIKYATAVHKCCCGCGSEVVTPISPAGWKLIFDGETVSLDPSIGNWSFSCQSHYWIHRNRVKWAPAWSKERIAAGRAFDAYDKERHLADAGQDQTRKVPPVKEQKQAKPPERGFWSKIGKLFSGK